MKLNFKISKNEGETQSRKVFKIIYKIGIRFEKVSLFFPSSSGSYYFILSIQFLTYREENSHTTVLFNISSFSAGLA